MRLSASRINTYLKCSWTYYCRYVLKLPDEGNDGQRRGTVTHSVLEYLLKPRHHKHIEQCKVDPQKDPVIVRLTEGLAKKEGVCDPENLSLIYGFIRIGVRTDFFCDGYELLPPEDKFHIVNEEPKYEILGYIDKSAKKECEALIVDYKTSKKKPYGKDKEFNVQALSYALALWKKYPDMKVFRVKFLYLKFVRTPVLEYEFRVATLRGFEKYLEKIYNLLSTYNVQKACANFGKNNDSWRLCGEFKKKDGTISDWVCPLKYAFLYWEVRDREGKVVKTAKDKNLLDKYDGDEYIIEQKFYAGCPAFSKKKTRNS